MLKDTLNSHAPVSGRDPAPAALLLKEVISISIFSVRASEAQADTRLLLLRVHRCSQGNCGDVRGKENE